MTSCGLPVERHDDGVPTDSHADREATGIIAIYDEVQRAEMVEPFADQNGPRKPSTSGPAPFFCGGIFLPVTISYALAAIVAAVG